MKIHSAGFSIARMLFLFSIVNGLACTPSGPVDRSREAVEGLADSTLLLKYKTGEISARDVAAQIQPKLEKLREEMTQDYRKAAEDLVFKRMLDQEAKQKGLPNAEAYLASLKSQIEVSDSDISDYVHRNKLASTPKEEVKRFLQGQLWMNKEAELRQTLLSQAGLEWKISNTTHAVSAENALFVKGAKNAGIRIDTFCDFGNPVCSAQRIGLEQILLKYPKETRVVFHPLPKADQVISVKAAIYAICASFEEKFWPMHDALYNFQARLTAEDLQKAAVNAGLDIKENSEFEKCTKDAKGSSGLAKELEAAHAAGISEAPVLLLNGETVQSMDELEAKLRVGKK